MFACLQWSHGSRVCVLVSLVSLHMHVCSKMIGRVFACLSNFSIVSLVASRVVCLPRLLRLPSLVAWSRAWMNPRDCVLLCTIFIGSARAACRVICHPFACLLYIGQLEEVTGTNRSVDSSRLRHFVHTYKCFTGLRCGARGL